MARLAKRPCGYCGGRGKVAIMAPQRTCIVCDGFKFVFVPSGFVKCPDCGGIGRRYVGGRYQEPVRCKRCRGSGWSG